MEIAPMAEPAAAVAATEQPPAKAEETTQALQPLEGSTPSTPQSAT